PEPPAIRPHEDRANERERREHAEMTDPREYAQRRRPLGIRLLTLGIERLAGIPEQDEFAAEEFQPRAGLRRDEREGAIGPERRDLRRRERSSERVFGELGGILPF